MRRFVAAVLLLCFGFIGGCAVSHISKEQQEKQARLHFQLGVDALQKGLLPKAFDELMQADRLRPNQPEILDALAYAWRLRGEVNKAETFYKRSLRIKSRPETHNNYANLLIELHRYDEAVKQARQALADPRYRNQHLALMNLGDALLAQGHAEEALSAYQKAKLLRPEDSLPTLKQAKAYLSIGKPRYAEALLKTALRENPQSRELTEMLVSILSKNQPALAKAYLIRFRDNATDEMDKAWAEEQMEKLP
ncbi:MAG: tetratricopeptide repeat protein [Zetaproteobacteria bacterium]|nr:MAG: tetratricopeptide repeat protein [Zetaproteobacteria bacterium]